MIMNFILTGNLRHSNTSQNLTIEEDDILYKSRVINSCLVVINIYFDKIYFDFYIGRHKWDLKHNYDDKNSKYTNEVYYGMLRFKYKSQHRNCFKNISLILVIKYFFFLFLIKFASNKNMRKDVSFLW